MTIDELSRIKETYIDERKRELEQGVVIVDVHMGTCGIAAGSRNIFTALHDEIARLGCADVKLRITGVRGTLQHGAHDHRPVSRAGAGQVRASRCGEGP
ncbi:MAG: hypothetical protein AB2L22_18375 [Syntrophales bacterium]